MVIQIEERSFELLTTSGPNCGSLKEPPPIYTLGLGCKGWIWPEPTENQIMQVTRLFIAPNSPLSGLRNRFSIFPTGKATLRAYHSRFLWRSVGTRVFMPCFQQRPMADTPQCRRALKQWALASTPVSELDQNQLGLEIFFPSL